MREDEVRTSGSYTWENVSYKYFVYDGWNVIEEIEALSWTLQAQYTWGIDLSHTLQGAGGIGGLLATHIPAEACAGISGGVQSLSFEDGGSVSSAGLEGAGQRAAGAPAGARLTPAEVFADVRAAMVASGIRETETVAAQSAVQSDGGQMQTLTTGTDCDYWYLYDANGNVGQLLWYRPAEAVPVGLAAAYEYDPYGNTLVVSDEDGSGIAAANKFRFSTKWLNDELAEAGQPGALDTTGLYYYGYRYYSPNLGRWISRDPIESPRDPNSQEFLRNAPTQYLDPLGDSVIGIPNAPGGGFPPQPPTYDNLPATPQCTIALKSSGLSALGQTHYGLSITTPSGTWTVDAGPQTNPKGRGCCDLLGFGAPIGSPISKLPNDSSPCACVLREVMNWKATHCYAAILCPNSNTAVNMVLKKCGLHIARPAGAWCWHQTY